MLFNSYVFILVFLPISLLGYFGLNALRSKYPSKVWLLLCSLFFYAFYNPYYLFIIIGSIILNYGFSLILQSEKVSRTWAHAIMLFAVLLNIAVLFYYKYFDFFLENINALFSTSYTLRYIVLPLGISFFTFQQVCFVIDCYKKTVPRYSFLDYALFVSFFPPLIAGPIVLHGEMLPQFSDPDNRKFNHNNFAEGITAFAFGLAKKVLVADTFSKIVIWGFGQNPENLGTVNAIFVMLAYTFQIYFDFSGYCDMATGLGRMFNIKIPMNFNSPYKGVTIKEFWERWHLTLTRFFTSYVYIPLGGNRKGKFRTCVNILIVFLISGLWHGANWTFIIWGAMHGIASVVTRIFSKAISRIPRILTWLCTFIFVNIAWVYFRANNISHGNQIIKQIFRFEYSPLDEALLNAADISGITFLGGVFGANIGPLFPVVLLYVFALFACLYMKNTNERIEDLKPRFSTAFISIIFIFWSIMSMSGLSEFIYYNF